MPPQIKKDESAVQRQKKNQKKKGSKAICLLFTARQGEGEKVSNAHMLTISLTASHLLS